MSEKNAKENKRLLKEIEVRDVLIKQIVSLIHVQEVKLPKNIVDALNTIYNIEK